MLKAFIQPLGDVEDIAIRAARDVLVNVLGLDVEISPRKISIPGKFYNAKRRQYNSNSILKWLMDELNFKDKLTVGLADADAYVEGLNFVFGEAIPISRTCIVYLVRLRQGFYGLTNNNEIFIERVMKEVLHEVGHLLYLQHCSNPRCVMRFSNSIYDTDFKKAMLCTKCSRQLLHRGITIPPPYILP